MKNKILSAICMILLVLVGGIGCLVVTATPLDEKGKIIKDFANMLDDKKFEDATKLVSPSSSTTQLKPDDLYEILIDKSNFYTNNSVSDVKLIAAMSEKEILTEEAEEKISDVADSLGLGELSELFSMDYYVVSVEVTYKDSTDEEKTEIFTNKVSVNEVNGELYIN